MIGNDLECTRVFINIGSKFEVSGLFENARGTVEECREIFEECFGAATNVQEYL